MGFYYQQQPQQGFYYNQQPKKQGFYYNQQPKQGFYYNQPEGFYYNQQEGFYYDQQDKVLNIFFLFILNHSFRDFITISVIPPKKLPKKLHQKSTTQLPGKETNMPQR